MLYYWLVNIVILFALSWLLPGFEVKSLVSATVFIIILTLLNWTVKPILNILTLPINFLTLGIFGGIINLLVIYLAAIWSDGVVLFGGNWEKILTLIILAVSLSAGQAFVRGSVGDESRDRY